MTRAVVFALALVLAGCAGTPLKMPFAHDAAPSQAAPAPAPKPVIKTVVKQVCIRWDKWSDDDLKALRDALVPVPDGSIIIKAAREFYRYYADAKACSDAQK